MILSTNAFNWAALRSGMSTGDFMASLTPEREEELFKQYNEWRRSKGLTEEKAPTPPITPSAAPKQRKTPAAFPVDDLSVLINEVAAEVEEEEAKEAALIQDALDGADELVEEETAAVPEEIEEEIEADEEVPTTENELPSEDNHITDGTEVIAHEAGAASAVDFAMVIRSLPKEPDPALYSRIKEQFGETTKDMAQTALEEAKMKHRGTAAIRTFLGWLNDV